MKESRAKGLNLRLHIDEFVDGGGGGLAAELREPLGEPARAGDYVIWAPRLPHTTGEPDGFSAGTQPRQVLYMDSFISDDGFASDARLGALYIGL